MRAFCKTAHTDQGTYYTAFQIPRRSQASYDPIFTQLMKGPETSATQLLPFRLTNVTSATFYCIQALKGHYKIYFKRIV